MVFISAMGSTAEASVWVKRRLNLFPMVAIHATGLWQEFCTLGGLVETLKDIVTRAYRLWNSQIYERGLSAEIIVKSSV